MLKKNNILFVSCHSPHIVKCGATQRTQLLYEALKVNNHVDLFLVGNKAAFDDSTINILKEKYGLVGIFPESPFCLRGPFGYICQFNVSFLNRLARHVHEYMDWFTCRNNYWVDAGLTKSLQTICLNKKYKTIVTRYLRPACISDSFKFAPVLVDLDDIDTDVQENSLNTSDTSLFKRILIKQKIKSLKRGIPFLIGKCKGVWVSKKEDLFKIRHDFVEVLPNIPYHFLINNVVEPLPWISDKKIILGVGSLGWPPNRDGFTFFIENIWPLVIKKLPEARLHIIGSGLDAATNGRWLKVHGVSVLGYVHDLAPYYQDASFSVAPVYSGGGSNIKVIESLSYGRGCICSPHATRGFDTAEGIIKSDTGAVFAERCINLLNDWNACKKLGNAGYVYAMKYHSYKEFQNSVNRLLIKTES
jgi:glycosyltransferase involved in cell wall biosynthesis